MLLEQQAICLEFNEAPRATITPALHPIARSTSHVSSIYRTPHPILRPVWPRERITRELRRRR